MEQGEEERWKTKYLDLVDTAEQNEKKWSRLHDIMCETISKVSVAAKGIDPILDSELDRLQQLIHKEEEAEELLVQANALGELLKNLEDEKNKKTSQLIFCFEKLLTPLTHYSLPDEQAKTVADINRLIHAPDAVDKFDIILEGYITILNALPQLVLKDNQLAPISWSKFMYDSLQRALVALGWQQPPPARDRDTFVAQQSSNTLIELLDLLIKQESFLKEAALLRERLLDGLKVGQLPEILHAIVDMLSILFDKDHARLEKFLKTISMRFMHIENFMLNLSDADALSEVQNQTLNEGVCEDLKIIKDDINSAQSIEELEEQLGDKLDKVIGCMAEYRENSELRVKNFKQQLQQMQDRLNESTVDIKELESALATEQRIARHDSLTQLHNRLAFEHTLKTTLASHANPEQVILVVVDIDFFKKINDAYGHLAGDKVLKKLASVLEASAESAKMIARYGGEEFVILFVDQPLADIKILVETIRHNVENLGFHFQDSPVQVTASFGVATAKIGEAASTLFQRSDEALYRAKKTGRNRIVLA